MASYLTASQASARLGVSRQTLYSYVSRGLLRAHPGDTHRQRRYLLAEVDQLATGRSRARSPVRAARDALNWGRPVVESSISTIDAGRLYYRGKNVLSLIETSSAEDVAALLWQCPKSEAFVEHVPSSKTSGGRNRQRTVKTLLSGFAMAGGESGCDSGRSLGDSDVRSYGDLVRMLASCALGRNKGAAPLRLQCADAWSLSTRQARLVEIALMLCADHELNASSFTVRCIASTAASLHACVVGGLAALSGPRHGGMTTRVETLWNETDRSKDMQGTLRGHWQQGDLPGFGHPLYPDGDIRASAILQRLNGRRRRWEPLAKAVDHLTGRRPSLDFALVALRRHLQLPVGAAFSIFALGRSIGWIAHALEQRSQGTLIRPRAAYVGLHPDYPD